MSILSDEISVDPLGQGYAAMTDVEVAEDLNTEYRTVNYLVGLDGLNMSIREAGKWSGFTEKAELQTVAGTFDNQAMKEFMDLFPSMTGQNELDLQGTYMNAADGLLFRCVDEGSMGSAVATGIESFGEKLVSRAVELEIQPSVVTAGNVANARYIS